MAYMGSTMTTWVSFMLAARNEYENCQLLAAAACSPLLLRSTRPARNAGILGGHPQHGVLGGLAGRRASSAYFPRPDSTARSAS